MAADRLPQIFDPTSAYREMGLIAQGGMIPIVGSMRALASPSPETTVTLIALSLRNRGLTFRRDGASFLAEYRIEIAVRREGSLVAQVQRDERVRVASFQETQRSDESIIFQQQLPLPPGAYTVNLLVRDRNGPSATRADFPVTVPPVSRARVAQPVPVYEVTPRTSLSEGPRLVMNPRGSAEFGADSLRVYLETYGLRPGTALAVAALEQSGRPVWSDTLRVDNFAQLLPFVVSVPPSAVSIGRHELRVTIDGEVAASMPFLVTFSDQYAVANLEEIVSLMRYFPQADTLRAILSRATPEERGEAWRRFWRSSDPNPATPENEAIDQYLTRVQVATERFREEGVAGWLTDRGEVYITLGEPDNVVDRRPDIQGRGRNIWWEYYEYRLTLNFVDDNGFGRFRLDPRSRAEFLRVVNRLRRQ